MVGCCRSDATPERGSAAGGVRPQIRRSCLSPGWEVMSPHKALERGTVNPEGLGGTADASAMLLKGLPEKLLFKPCEGLLPPRVEAIPVLTLSTGQDRLGQVFGCDERPLGICDRSLDRASQLPHVPRPVVLRQYLEGRVGTPVDLLAVAADACLEKVSHQKGNVLPPLPEGRNPDLDDVEPKEEVLPEPASSHFVVDVAIRRGHEADVYGDRLYPADPAYGALFHGPKELRLKTGVQLAHLVEEERAAVSGLEETLLRNLGSGEGTPVIAEELGLQQTLGNCGAIDPVLRLLLP